MYGDMRCGNLLFILKNGSIKVKNGDKIELG